MDRFLLPNHPNDARTLAALDELVRSAAYGDARAIGAVAIVFGPHLYDEARAMLGDHAEDALFDLFDRMSKGSSPFHPPAGRPVAWMRAQVRAFARRRSGAHRRPNLSPQGDTVMEDTQIDRLYRFHVRSLCNAAYRILQNPDDAEDAVHDAFVELAEGAGDMVASDDEVRAHLERLVTRLCGERRKDTDRRSCVVRVLGPPTPPTPITPMALAPVDKEAA